MLNNFYDENGAELDALKPRRIKEVDLFINGDYDYHN